jgi:hypothetical protein
MFSENHPRACVIKLFVTLINSVTQKAGVFVKASKKRTTITKALAFYRREFITTVKSFMIQAHMDIRLKTFFGCSYFYSVMS